MGLLMTKSEAADRLRCSLRTVDTLIQKGDLKPVRIGRLVRVEGVELERFVRSKSAEREASERVAS